MEKYFQNCYVNYQDQILKLGNEKIERAISLGNNLPRSQYLLNKDTEYIWEHESGSEILLWNIPGLNFENTNLDIDIYQDNYGGLSETHLVAEVLFAGELNKLLVKFRIFPGLPFIYSRMYVKGDKIKANTENNEEKSINNPDQSQFTGIENNYNQKQFSDTDSEIIFPTEDTIEALPISRKHLKLESIVLEDVTGQLLHPNQKQD